jgi:hypothetical protein
LFCLTLEFPDYDLWIFNDIHGFTASNHFKFLLNLLGFPVARNCQRAKELQGFQRDVGDFAKAWAQKTAT